MSRIITPEIEAEMLSLRRQGLSNREIGERLGFGGDSVYRHIGKCGRRVPYDTIREIERRYREGENYKQIAEAVAMSVQRVVYYVKQARDEGRINSRRNRESSRPLVNSRLSEIVEGGDVEKLRRLDIIPNRNIRGLTADEYARLIEMARDAEIRRDEA